ncbi:hypothetical protein Tco_0660039 [Tanacetum coccineum]
MLLSQVQEAGVVLDEEQQDFLADSLEETNDYKDLQLQVATNFKADHVDAYDSDCDDEDTTNAIFMANLSPVGSLNDDTVAPRYDSDTLSKVHHNDTYHDSDMLNSNIQELGYTENIMTTLAEHIIVAGAENRPPMLEKSMYDSWASRIRLFIKGKKNGRMMLDSIDEGPLVYPTVVGEDGQTRPKKYSELTEAQQLQDDCDVQATNIILHGLPPDVYALVNHQEAAKDIWDRVKLLMKGTELSYQERECRLYNLFDKFASVQGETLYKYY